MAQKMRAVRLFAPKDIRCVEVDVPHIEKDQSKKLRCLRFGYSTSYGERYLPFSDDDRT